jgi:hypothetical protein
MILCRLHDPNRDDDPQLVGPRGLLLAEFATQFIAVHWSCRRLLARELLQRHGRCAEAEKLNVVDALARGVICRHFPEAEVSFLCQMLAEVEVKAQVAVGLSKYYSQVRLDLCRAGGSRREEGGGRTLVSKVSTTLPNSVNAFSAPMASWASPRDPPC